MRVIYNIVHSETLSLYRIQSDVGLSDISSIRYEIEEKLIIFLKKYKVQPFSLLFSATTREYHIKINHSYVGNIVFQNFIIKILPKYINISTEKILKLASNINYWDELQIGENYFRDFISNDELVSSEEFFYNLFADKVDNCIKNGLIHGFGTYNNTSTNLKGILDIKKYTILPIQKNLVHQLNIIRTPDLEINRIIKSVISEIINKTNNSDLLIKLRSVLRSFSDIKVIDLPSFFVRDDYKVPLQRNDYNDVLDLAEILINGFDPDLNCEVGFTPEYLINLDLLFEKLCFIYLSKILNKKYFEVNYQYASQHIFSELGLSGKIIPDIFISTSDKNFTNKSIILDAKNKISGTESSFSVATADIYQLLYYSKVLQSKFVFILYPGDKKNSSSYVIKGSQGDSDYKKSCVNKIKILHQNNQIIFFEGIFFILWRVNLEGSIKDTLNNFNELSNLISELMISDDLFRKNSIE